MLTISIYKQMCLSKVHQIFGLLTKGCFDSVLSKVVPVAVDKNGLKCEMLVEEAHANKMGTLHGGLVATIVDSVSTVDLIRCGHPPGVSINISIQYFSSIPIGRTILIETDIAKVGKRLAFCNVNVRDKETLKLSYQGQHTKYIGN